VWDKGVVCLASVELGISPKEVKWEDVPTGMALVVKNGQLLKERRIKNLGYSETGYQGGYGRTRGWRDSRTLSSASIRPESTDIGIEGCNFKTSGQGGIVVYSSKVSDDGPLGLFVSFISCWTCDKNLSDQLLRCTCPECGRVFCDAHYKQHLDHTTYSPKCSICEAALGEEIVCLACKKSFCIKDATEHMCDSRYKTCDPKGERLGKPHKVKNSNAQQCSLCEEYFCKSHLRKHECTPKVNPISPPIVPATGG
jgi:hypothetical protein